MQYDLGFMMYPWALFAQTRFHLQCFCYVLRLSFTWRQSRPILKPHRFENAVKSGAFSKRYGLTGRVNGETASIWERLRFLARNWLACKE